MHMQHAYIRCTLTFCGFLWTFGFFFSALASFPHHHTHTALNKRTCSNQSTRWICSLFHFFSSFFFSQSLNLSSHFLFASFVFSLYLNTLTIEFYPLHDKKKTLLLAYFMAMLLHLHLQCKSICISCTS